MVGYQFLKTSMVTDDRYYTAKSICPICSRSLQETPQGLVLLFLCRHTVHASCVSGGDSLPQQPDAILRGAGLSSGRGLSWRIALYVCSFLHVTSTDIHVIANLWSGLRYIKAARSATREAKGYSLTVDTTVLGSCIPMHSRRTLSTLISWNVANFLHSFDHPHN